MKVLAPFHLSESEITTTLRTLWTEWLIRVDWGGSFDEHRTHKMMKIEPPRPNGIGEVEIDDSAMFPMSDAAGEAHCTDTVRET